MRFFADFHVHSRYCRTSSPDMTLENMDQWAVFKGVSLLGTGDFTHPLWLNEISKNLKEVDRGIYQYKKTKFILSAEISCVFEKKNKTRKIHILLLVPSIETAEKMNKALARYGSLSDEGRPVLALAAKNLVDLALGIDPETFIVPAHIWAPWYSLFGAAAGFDSLEDCFEEMTPQIKAVETGLASDPAMNWRLSALDKIALISNSDAHAPGQIGREANLFDLDLNYPAIIQALTARDQKKFLATVNTYPAAGKNFLDGHRDCGPASSPVETRKNNGLCLSCGQKISIGVLNRLEKLADRPEGFLPKKRIPFYSIVPLEEIIAQALDVHPGTKAVEEEYIKLVNQAGGELRILLEAEIDEIKNFTSLAVLENLARYRSGKIRVIPGYDGVYGKIKLRPEEPVTAPRAAEYHKTQMGLF